MTKILDGNEVGQSIRNRVLKEVTELSNRGIVPKLAILRVGEDDSSISYENSAVRVMKSCQIETKKVTLPHNTNEDKVLFEIDQLNKENTIHGIILMHPLPSHLTKLNISEAIDPRKDVDGLHPVNLGRLIEGDANAMVPSTPQAVIEILNYYGYVLEGLDVVVIGSSSTVGKPLSIMLSNLNATVSNLHIYTKDIHFYSENADILISATGELGLIDKSYIKERATVIDVGYGHKDGQLMGDVQFEEVFSHVSAITPVPGGVGAVTTSVLASQVVRAAKKLNNF